MKENPFFSGLVCGIALTLAVVIAFMTYSKTPTMVPPPASAVKAPLPAAPQIQLNAINTAGMKPSPLRGNPSAAVTILEYSDFHCPFCKKVVPTLAEVLKNYSDKVRLVFKHSPLSETPGQGSFLTHEASVCAHEQGKFWEFYDGAFALSNHPDAAALRQIASQIGLDSATFESCLKSDRPLRTIKADLQVARIQGVDGTPTFVINGRELSGAVPYENFQKKIDEALANPGVVPPAASAKPATPAAPAKPVEFNDLAGRPSEGPDKAPVTLVEFSDFHCPFCQRLEPTIDRIMKEYSGKVRKVWRHFPLPMHTGSDRTHQASECANEQGKFWKYHNKLFENFSVQPKDDAFLTSIADKSGLNGKKFKKCMEGTASKEVVQKDVQKGAASGVRGTPAVFVNGRLVSGAQPFDNFKRIIDEELSKGKPAAQK